MAITKETQIGKIEVVGKHKVVQVRTDIVVMEDGEELSRKYHRHALSPDADISNEHSEVQAVCNAVWTQDVKDAYETFKASQEAALNQE
jgi:recombinational DNA repair protein RecR